MEMDDLYSLCRIMDVDLENYVKVTKNLINSSHSFLDISVPV